MHYYPHHIGDYRSATSHLSNEEDLAYRRLLEMYYDTEQPIPLEIQQVARRLRVTEAAVQVALTDFFEQKKDGWHHARCESEIEKYKASSTKKSVAGKASGLARAAKKEQVLNTRSTGVEQNANDVELTKNQEPRTKNHISPKAPKGGGRKSGREDGFTEFWETWPTSLRKVGKVKCQEKWVARNLSSIADTIIAHVKLMKQGEQWQNGYEPSPMTYINQSRWEDGAESAGKVADDQFAGVM
jgi:uncharacterized protein YdaU (DUF1376 family)